MRSVKKYRVSAWAVALVFSALLPVLGETSVERPALLAVPIGMSIQDFRKYPDCRRGTKPELSEDGLEYSCLLAEPLSILRVEAEEGVIFRIKLSTDIDEKTLRRSIEKKYGKRDSVKHDHHYWYFGDGRYRLTLYDESVTLEDMKVWRMIQNRAASSLMKSLEP